MTLQDILLQQLANGLILGSFYALVALMTAGMVIMAEARDILRAAYEDKVFVEVIDGPPQTRWAVSSNRAFVTAFVDHRAGVVIAQAAIDNLVKGAAGQAVQCANLMVGLDEAVGLPLSGWMP